MPELTKKQLSFTDRWTVPYYKKTSFKKKTYINQSLFLCLDTRVIFYNIHSCNIQQITSLLVTHYTSVSL